MKSFRRLPPLFAAVAVALTINGHGLAQSKKTTAEPSTAAIEKVIRDYLKKHPEIVFEAMEAYRAKQQAEEEAAALRAVSERKKELNNDPDSVVGGNPKGDVTVVEFFDYRCGVCKRVHPIVNEMTERDKNIRRVYKEWPILGPASVFASRAAIASRKQGTQKYIAFHNAMMEANKALTAETILALANKAGLDLARLRNDMSSPEVEQIIRRNYRLAEALKLTGTPSFVIGDQLLRGARDLDTMMEMVRDARKKS